MGKILAVVTVAFSMLISSAWAVTPDEEAAANVARQYMMLSYAGKYQESFNMVSDSHFVAEKDSTMAMLIQGDAEYVKKFLEMRGLPNDSLTSLNQMPAKEFYYKVLFFMPDEEAVEKMKNATVEVGEIKTLQSGDVNVELKISVSGGELPEKSVFNLTKENGSWKIVI